MIHQNEGNQSLCADIYPQESGLMLVKSFFMTKNGFLYPNYTLYDFKLFLTKLKNFDVSNFTDTLFKNACSNPPGESKFPKLFQNVAKGYKHKVTKF